MKDTMTGRRHYLLGAVALVLACSAAGPTEVSYETTPQGIQAGYVTVTATSAGLKLTNQTEKPVYTFAVERNTSALVDWVPCTYFGNCGDGLAPGATTTIPWEKVVGWKPEAREYVVSWYHVEIISGKPTLTSMQSVVVKR
jgi:hypothetical protein